MVAIASRATNVIQTVLVNAVAGTTPRSAQVRRISWVRGVRPVGAMRVASNASGRPPYRDLVRHQQGRGMKNTGRLEWIERLREYTPWLHKNNSATGQSSAWVDAPLNSYLEELHSNSIATYARKSEARRLHDIDALLSHFGENASRVSNNMSLEVLVPLMLFYRAHSAFKAAAALALGGATTGAMPVLRLCLEYAGYASITHGNFAAATLWLYRSDNDQRHDQRKAAANNALSNSNLYKSIARRDADLASHYATLYERLTEFGAHPNELEAISEILLERSETTRGKMADLYLQDNARRLDHSLRSAGRVGACTLEIFELLFAAEFRELGISVRIPHVSRGLNESR